MKKLLICTLLFCAAQAQGFDGNPGFTARHAGVDHRLSLSHWRVDRQGVPSFDYVYEQNAGSCHFRVAGHAQAMVEETNGKRELVVFNPEDARGRAMAQVVAYDSDDIAFSLPYKGKLNRIGLRSPMPPALRARACDKGDDEGLALTFGK